MKNFFRFAFLPAFLSSVCLAQWTEQNPVPHGNHLWSTFFVNDSTGWIVGSDGFVKKTTNSGLDWVEQNSGTSQTLKSVQFINENTGWICGEDGLIIKTTNGGQSWIELSSGTTQILNDLHFIDINTGYIVGFNETILKTTNGGTNWFTLSSGNTFDLFSVDFIDTYIGYAVGGRDSSKFLKTTDGGITWNIRTLDLVAINTPMLNCVEFIDENTGWVGSEGQFLNHSGNISKTTDGGETWFSTSLWRPEYNDDPSLHQYEDSYFDNQRGIRSIYFKDANNGYAVGGTRDGWWRSIFTTTNGGATWVKKYGHSEQTGLLSVFVSNNGKGIAVGYSGVIYITENNGFSWSQILSGNNSLYYAGDWISSVFMVNENLGWAAGYRKGIWYYPVILKTTNGGKVWFTNKEFGESLFKTSANVFFINENTGWVSFYERSSFKTTDGGATWFNSSMSANEKYFADENTGWAAYEPIGIFKSINGGNSWIQKSSVNSRSIHFSDLVNGWAVGEGGTIVKSTNQGESWELKNSGTNAKLNSVRFYNNYKGVAAGNNGTVLLSDDGGETWNIQNSGTSLKLASSVFTSETTIWVVGNNGKILNTTDFGSNWISFDGITSSDLASVYFFNQNKGWAAGGNSILIFSNEPVQTAAYFNPVWSGNGFMNMNIFVTGAELTNGESLSSGDEIAVYDGEYCVGAVRLSEPIPASGHIQIFAATDNPATPQRDGFINGNTITFKFWLASTLEEVTAYSVQYFSGNGTFVSNGTATVQFSNVIPVELISFTAEVNSNSVLLKWQTATELNNYGFEIERSLNKTDWTKIGFLYGAGLSTSPVNYMFSDENPAIAAKNYYRLKQLDINGSYEYSKVLEVELLPVLFELSQNYPNPFNPSTQIRYSVSQLSRITIIVYDILGSEIAILVNEDKEPGSYVVEFNTASVGPQIASGIYFYQLKAVSAHSQKLEFNSVKKMNLIK